MTQRTWLITGIGRGFGRELADQLLARGDRVAGTVRDRAAVADLAERYGERLWLAELELTRMPSIRAVVDRAFSELGRIDVVVSNAGYGLFGAAEEATDEQALHQLSTNLMGSIQLIRACLPHLRGQGGGRILQLSSVAGQAAFPGTALYNASKWGIEGFVDALAHEVAPFGIGATLVEPGAARTDFRYESSRMAPKIDAYDGSPARAIRKLVEARTDRPPGDPARMAAAMIASVDVEPAPRRLALGSDAYRTMHKQLSDRLAALEAQKDLAFSTDYPPGD